MNKHWQKIFNLFKLVNKDTTAMPLTELTYYFVPRFFYYLFLMLDGITYSK